VIASGGDDDATQPQEAQTATATGPVALSASGLAELVRGTGSRSTGRPRPNTMYEIQQTADGKAYVATSRGRRGG
jgi:hypothetical protein